MTSLERRKEARYQRRKAARDQKKTTRYAQYDDYCNIIQYKSLHKANLRSKRNVCWKASVQGYQMNMLRNYHNTYNDLKAGKNITKGFVEFDTPERGKIRHIRSVHYSERVVQRSVCDNSLVPMLSRNLIYDNNACLENKGVDQALDRMDAHLQQFYRANGNSNDGVILIFDFKGYFDSIRHDICFQKFQKEFHNEMIIELLWTFVYPFGFPFANGNWRKAKRNTGADDYSGMSLGLGSQISQILAVSYPNMLDHYIKEVLRVRWYGRYMDDGYMIFKTKAEANEALAKIIGISELLGLTISKNKTHIANLSDTFVYLKVRHRLTDSGKAVRKLSKESVTRQRRKLKKFHKFYLEGKMSIDDIKQAYGSWKGYALHRNSRQTVMDMDKLFVSLFETEPPKCKLKKKVKGR